MYATQPLPDLKDYMRLSDRRQVARLKLHFLMARLRTGYRAFLELGTHKNNKSTTWATQLAAELHNILVHVGYCSVMGYSFEYPYLLIEMAEKHMYYQHFPSSNLPQVHIDSNSMDAEFNRDQDKSILGEANDIGQWWLEDPKGPTSITMNQVVHDTHFASYLRNIQKRVAENPEQFLHPVNETEQHAAGNADGHATDRADGDTARRIASTAAGKGPMSNAGKSSVREGIKAALTKLSKVEESVNYELRVAKEAIARSQYELGVYEAVRNIWTKHGAMPFTYEGRLHPVAQRYYPAAPSSPSNSDGAPDALELTPSPPIRKIYEDIIELDDSSNECAPAVLKSKLRKVKVEEEEVSMVEVEDESASNGTSVPMDLPDKFRSDYDGSSDGASAFAKPLEDGKWAKQVHGNRSDNDIDNDDCESNASEDDEETNEDGDSEELEDDSDEDSNDESEYEGNSNEGPADQSGAQSD